MRKDFPKEQYLQVLRFFIYRRHPLYHFIHISWYPRTSAITLIRWGEPLPNWLNFLLLNRFVKRGTVLGATERETEAYSMYAEYRSDRATTQCATFHGASANSAKPTYLPQALTYETLNTHKSIGTFFFRTHV